MSNDYAWGFDGMTHEHMVKKMKQGWKSSETPCGRGSELAMTVDIQKVLAALLKDFNISSVADVGAGDLRWALRIPEIQSLDIYHAYDLVPRHELVIEFDATREVLPHAYDLILCRHVLNHLSPRLALQCIGNFKESGSRWLLMTNCENQRKYWEMHGMWPLLGKIGIWEDCTKWQLELYDLQKLEVIDAL